METRRTNIIAGITFCLYLTTVALLCFLHGDNVPSITGKWFGLPADKVAHLLMFFPFIPLSFFTFSKRNAPLVRSLILLVVLMTIGGATAYTTELIQDMLSYRTYDIKDLLADCIGLAAGYAFITFWLIIKHLNNRH
jgi:VanZ family protein